MPVNIMSCLLTCSGYFTQTFVPTQRSRWMSRPRLKSRGGCLRCRRRRIKCDETRPRCGFCTRWNIPCSYPEHAQHQDHGREDQPAQSAAGRHAASTQLVVQEISAADPFDMFPACQSFKEDNVLYHLHVHFRNVMDDVLPFNFRGPMQIVFHEWGKILAQDDAACCSLMSFCLKTQNQQHQNSTLVTKSLKYETRALSLLRRRIESSAAVTDGTLLAAAFHYGSVALHSTDLPQAGGILRGLRALINARGELQTLFQEANPAVMTCLTICNMFDSALNVGRPPMSGLGQTAKRPRFFDVVMLPYPRDLVFAEYLSPDLMNLLRDLRLLLSLRNSPISRRNLSPEQERYVFDLMQDYDNKLSVLRSFYVGKQSVFEIAVLGITLVRWQIIPESIFCCLLLDICLRQLRTAVCNSPHHSSEIHRLVVIWSIILALVGPYKSADRDWFLAAVTKALIDWHREATWPRSWRQYLRTELQQILWHERLDEKYDEVCTDIEAKKQEMRV